MPDVTQDKYVEQIPRFVLPKEFSNEPPTAAKQPEAPKEAPKVEKVVDKAPPPAIEAAPEPAKEEVPEPTETPPAKPTGLDNRTHRAIRKAAEANARAEQLSRELAELREKSKPQIPVNAPRMEDFNDVQKYAEAFASYEKDNAIKDYEKKQRDQAEQARTKQVITDWEERSAKSKHEDYDEVVGDLQPTTPWAMAIMTDENGPDVAYYLGSHQNEARKIFSLDPVSQIREISKLSIKLQAPAEKPKTSSKAPPPIEPVSTGGASTGTEIEPNMPYEKYRSVGNKMFRGR